MQSPVRRMRSRPSPALVVAVAALVAALAGTAIAGPAATTSAPSKKKVKKISRKQANKQIDKRLPLESEDIADGAVSTDKIADDAVSNSKLSNPTYSALVQANGTFVRGVGADGNNTQRINAGNYRVAFENDVSQCTYQATPANVNQSLTAHADFDANTQRVFVSLRNSVNGTRQDGNFQVAVHC